MFFKLRFSFFKSFCSDGDDTEDIDEDESDEDDDEIDEEDDIGIDDSEDDTEDLMVNTEKVQYQFSYRTH